MEFVNFLGQNNVVTFFLLFVRTGALMIFFPFFSHMQIPVVVKTALAFMLTI
ncbi:flagellar biosynthetic protein FliR [Campylobacter hyointestinalis]|nr:flagellar biosynthetic protein FliR [Campylobacter hyointestinalis]